MSIKARRKYVSTGTWCIAIYIFGNCFHALIRQSRNQLREVAQRVIDSASAGFTWVPGFDRQSQGGERERVRGKDGFRLTLRGNNSFVFFFSFAGATALPPASSIRYCFSRNTGIIDLELLVLQFPNKICFTF